MPKEVATEMLCSGWHRQTNRERKMFRDARQKVFVSEQERKPLAEKLARKAKDRPLQWLGREIQRAAKHRRGVQRKYESLMRLEQTPVVERFVAALNLRAGHLDMVLDALESEINARRSRANGSRVHDHDVVIKTVFGTTRTWVDGLQYCFRRTEFPRWISSRNIVLGQ